MALHIESVGLAPSSASEGKPGPATALDGASLPSLPLRAGDISIPSLISLYMAHYTGRDMSRTYRLAWWSLRLKAVALQDLSDDEIHAALEHLVEQRARFFAGIDADGNAIHRAKRKPLEPSTINRYSAAIAAVITWSIKRRIAPKGYVHPCRSVERRTENNERVRYLSDAERQRLLVACKASSWPRLYMLVLVALTSGARKGELLAMRWADVDIERATAHVGRTKNGDPKALPLVPAAVAELKRFAGAADHAVFASPRKSTKPFGFEPKWHEAMKAAKLKDFTFHCLRHSCASMLAQNGASLLEIADVLGHRQIAMSKRYSHLTTQHKASLIDRVMGAIQ